MLAGASRLVAGALRRFSGGEQEKGEKEKPKRVRERDGLSLKDIQYPIHQLKQGALDIRAEWMRDCEIMKWVAEEADEAGNVEVCLETWSIGRFVHSRTMDLGQLFQVRILWGMAQLRVNLIGIKDSVPMDLMPMILETGSGNGYVLRLHDFNTYRLFARGRLVEGVSMGARLLFHVAMDLDLHQGTTLADFEQWPEDAVINLLKDHRPGQSYRRPSAEEAELVEIRRTGSDTVQIQEVSDLELEEDDEEDSEEDRYDDDWMDGNDTPRSWESGDLGQSPELNESDVRHAAQSPVQRRATPGRVLAAAGRLVEEMQSLPPAPPNSRRRFVSASGMGGASIYQPGSGPGGWRLKEDEEMEEIERMRKEMSSGDPQNPEMMETEGGGSESPLPGLLASPDPSMSSVELSPRAELSQANMSMSVSTASSSEYRGRGQGLMVSPEEVMKRMWEEMGPSWETEAKRMRTSRESGSSASSLGYIFSPILVKPGGEIRNVSSFTTNSTPEAGPSGTAEGGTAMRGASSSPLFTFDVTREMREWKAGWRGRMSMTGNLHWGLSSPLLFVDDMASQAVANEERFEEIAEEKEEEDNEVFDMSKVD